MFGSWTMRLGSGSLKAPESDCRRVIVLISMRYGYQSVTDRSRKLPALSLKHGKNERNDSRSLQNGEQAFPIIRFSIND